MGAVGRFRQPGGRTAAETLAFRAARDPEAPLSRTQATPAGAFRAASRIYLDGQRLDMQSLASELGISRATLYRWCGDRNQLLSDVLWHLSHRVFERAKHDNEHLHGAERVLAVFREHVGTLVSARPLHLFIQQETAAALQLLTSESGTVQRRTVEDLAILMREEEDKGAISFRADVDSLAYAIVRMTEGFIYHDFVVGAEPDVEKAASIVSLLLG